MSAAHADKIILIVCECKNHNSEENNSTIICDILNHSQENFVIETKQISRSCPDPIFFKNKKPNPVAILRGARMGRGPPVFAWPCVCPPSFFLNFPFKFVWLTYARLPNAFCKNAGHFVNSDRSELCRNLQAAQGKQRQSVLLSHN